MDGMEMRWEIPKEKKGKKILYNIKIFNISAILISTHRCALCSPGIYILKAMILFLSRKDLIISNYLYEKI